MSIDTDTAARPQGPLTGIFDRLETMLRPTSAGAFSANEAPLAAAIRAAARAFGRKPAPGSAPGSGEPTGDAIGRIARSAGLIAREIVLGADWQRSFALPVIAIRVSDGTPVALLPRGGGWRFVDGAAPRRPAGLDAALAADLQQRAWVLGPALADAPLTSMGLLSFGFSMKWRDLAAYSLMSALAGAALACIPMANFAVTDIVLPGRDVSLLQHVVAMLLALMLASLATRLSAALCQLRMDGRTGSMLRAAAADRMIRLSRAADAKPQSPATAALITRSAEGWHRGVWKLGLTILSGLLVAAPSLLVMTRTAPLAALLVLAVMLASIAVSSLVARAQINNLFSGPCSPTSWIGLSFEALSQIVTVRALGAEQRFFKLFSESFLGLKDRFLVSDRLGAVIHALEHALEALVVGVAIATVVILSPELTSGDSVAFAMAVMTVAGSAVSIVSGFSQACSLGMQRRMIEPFMNGTPALASVGGAPQRLRGEIVVHDLVVRPSRYLPPILDGVSLRIEPRSHIGIVGPSGSGKSTLINALLGLRRVDHGRILLDGVDLAQLDAAAVRRQIGVVGQSGRLFPGTILDNISAGVPLGRDEAWQALETAALADEVRAMPLGLSTPIGDADPVLSTGQVQRLLIARAVAHRPRVLVLDEATSALDPATEAKVAAALGALEATVIAVAHRLDTVRHCDCIHVLDDGRIVESGRYDALMAAGGLLAAMVAADARALGAMPAQETPLVAETVSPQPPPAAASGDASRTEALARSIGAALEAGARLKGARPEAERPSARQSLDDALARLERLKQVYKKPQG
ncbi:MAG: ATP-binding cassette domain-containing protein [Hyphomicrobiaceae bacterium]